METRNMKTGIVFKLVVKDERDRDRILDKATFNDADELRGYVTEKYGMSPATEPPMDTRYKFDTISEIKKFIVSLNDPVIFTP